MRMKALLRTASILGVGLLASGTAISACIVNKPNGKGCVTYTGTGTFSFTLTSILSVSNTVALNFGSVTRPSSGSGSIALTATSGTCVVTQTSVTSLTSPAASCATYNISGGSANAGITVTVSATSLTSGANSLTLTTNNSSATTLNSSGTLSVLVGGSIPLTSTTPSGTYTGTVTLSAVMN